MVKGWLPLNKGDVVDLVAISSFVPDSLISTTVGVLENDSGFKVSTKYLSLQPNNSLGYANTVGGVVDSVVGAIEDQDSKAVWCISGGSGASRLWRCLVDVNIKQKLPKPVIGFADCTFLHSMLYSKLGWPMLHGVFAGHNREVSQYTNGELNKMESIAGVVDLLCDNSGSHLEYSVEALNMSAVNSTDVVAGKVYGGNMGAIAATVGLPYGLNAETAKGKLLLLEEANSDVCSVDGSFYQLYNAGILRQVSAVIFGDLVNIRAVEGLPSDKTVLHMMMLWGELLDPLGVPVFRIGGLGQSYNNRPMPLFTDVKLQMSQNQRVLVVNTGAAFVP